MYVQENCVYLQDSCIKGTIYECVFLSSLPPSLFTFSRPQSVSTRYKPHVKVIIVLSARIPHFVLFLKGIKNQGVKEKMFQKNVPRMKKSIKR